MKRLAVLSFAFLIFTLLAGAVPFSSSSSAAGPAASSTAAAATRAADTQDPYYDPLLDNFIGRWVLTGTIGGQLTTHDVVAEWVLGHEYIRMNEVSREKDDKGYPQYEALVILGQAADPSEGEYACLWLDSTGATGLKAGSIGHAPRSSDRMAFVFKSAGGGFNTTFAYDKRTDTWTWTMDQEEGGKLQPFARLKMTRKK